MKISENTKKVAVTLLIGVVATTIALYTWEKFLKAKLITV